MKRLWPAPGGALYEYEPYTTLGAIISLHHKRMVIDRKVVIIGSMTFTSQATTLNDENILVIGKHNAGGQQLKTQKAFANYAAEKIERIVQTHC